MASQSHSIDFVGVQIPAEHRRIHFHAGGEVFNIHEHMMKSMCANWSEWEDELSTDEKGEQHYEDNYWPAWMYRAIILWLYRGTFLDGDQLTQWVDEVPEDWMSGSEQNPLACSLAIHLQMETHARGWFGFADLMITFLFKQYQEQRLPPSPAKLRQVYNSSLNTGVSELFVALHLKFYDKDVVKDGLSEQAQELRQDPMQFFYDFFIYRGTMERYASQLHIEAGEVISGEDVRTRYNGVPPLKLVDHHYHFTDAGDTGSECAACSTAELRAAFTID